MVTSFPAQARRVGDHGLPLQRRLFALRECVLHCAPYGFRATWHHLVSGVPIPRRLEDDPAALIRAVDELAEVRAVVLVRAATYAERRRREKAAGLRVPLTAAPWNSWGWSAIAYCPDPERHPTGRLAAVVRRVLDAHTAGVDANTRCLACGTDRHRAGRDCPICGVHPHGPRARWNAPNSHEQWARIWRRDVHLHDALSAAPIDGGR